MIRVEDYQLEYDLFLAESDLFENMIGLGSNIVSESAGLISLNEGVKETIISYLHKITEAIQKAWEKFKEIVSRGADIAYLKAIEKKMQDPKPDFTRNGYKDYDLSVLDRIKVITFNYEEMKPFLQSKEAFIEKYYSNLSGEGSLKERIEKVCIKSESDRKCDASLMKDMYKFVTSDYKQKMSSIESDLKTVNTSNRNIENIVSTITPSETATEAVVVYESYIHEDEKFTDGEGGPNKDLSSSNGKVSITKDVSVYVQTSTDIITAKMKVLKDAYAQSMECIKHYIKPEKTESSNKDEKKETDSSSNKTEVKI